MKIGCTLELGLFESSELEMILRLKESFGGFDRLLSFLGENVDTVELNMVRSSTPPRTVCESTRLLREYGMGATFHGALERGLEPWRFFAPYGGLFSTDWQEEYLITVHPLGDDRERCGRDTEAALRELCAYVDERGLPVRLCLENQRMKTARDTHMNCGAVCGMVERIAHPSLVLCFDFGHQLSGIRRLGEGADPVSEKLFSLTGHTHVHSYFNGTTHFPLYCGEVLLSENLSALLEAGYDGILNLELHHERFMEDFDLREAYTESVRILKSYADFAKKP